MSTPKRTTIYLDPEVYQALRSRAQQAHRSISEIVNGLVRSALAQQGATLPPLEGPQKSGSASFDRLVEALKRRRQARHRPKPPRP